MTKDYTKYLKRHLPFTDFDTQSIADSKFIVVIPVYLEDHLLDVVYSLQKCTPIEDSVSVLLVFNASEKSDENVVDRQFDAINSFRKEFIKSDWSIHFNVVEALNLPAKHFGAGLARKVGMDIAVRHFHEKSIEDGVIISLDADATVEKNYFTEIKAFFQYKEGDGCSIYFEHALEGEKFDEEVYEAITKYELHLRYYVESLKMIGFPYAFHTIGSCLAFTADAYVSVGGMNRRQGGEEFYFIQKLVQFGTYKNLNSTRVNPSSRISTRVPFGTGPTIKKIIEEEGDYETYNVQCFIDLKQLFDTKEKYYQLTYENYQKEVLNLPGRVRSFLLNSDFFNEITALSANCSTQVVFERRFYELFNAFKVVKYVNYIHEHFISKVPVFDAAIELLEMQDIDVEDVFEERELLELYRKIQKEE